MEDETMAEPVLTGEVETTPSETTEDAAEPKRRRKAKRPPCEEREATEDRPRACLVPYAVIDGAAHVLLGFRRTGPCAKAWTEIASDLDPHLLPTHAAAKGGDLLPHEAAARAGHAAVMGLLGSAREIQAKLAMDARVRLGKRAAGREYAYMLRVQEGFASVLADQHNNMARYLTRAFVKDDSKELVGCPPAVLAFTQVQWVPLEALKARALFAGATATARAAFGVLSAAGRITLAPRTIELLRHVIPTLEAYVAAT